MAKSLEGHVLTCSALDCSYNEERCCSAPTIEVGADHPSCDMYTTDPVEHTAIEPAISDCSIWGCTFNASHVCHAAAVTMMPHSGHADCGTFRMA
jgi:hypothetical protein